MKRNWYAIAILRWGCIGTLLAILGLAFLAAFLLLLLTGGALVLAL